MELTKKDSKKIVIALLIIVILFAVANAIYTNYATNKARQERIQQILTLQTKLTILEHENTEKSAQIKILQAKRDTIIREIIIKEKEYQEIKKRLNEQINNLPADAASDFEYLSKYRYVPIP